MQTDEMNRLHEKTAVLVTRFLSHANISSDVITAKCFIDLLTHLNPMAEIPTSIHIEELRTQLEVSFDPNEPSTVPLCIFCGSDEFPRMSLSEDDAAIYLALAVLSNRKSLSAAKKDMCRDRFVFCQGHTFRANQEMVAIIGNADIDSVERVAVTKISPVYSVYIKLKSMQQLYTDQKVDPITYYEFRSVLKKWLEINAARRLMCEVSPDETTGPMDIVVKSEQQEFEESPPLLELGIGPPINMKAENEQQMSSFPNTSMNPEGTVIKLEEPDVDESTVVCKRKIYTLKNGKKVIKAPMPTALLARKTTGSLVTYRRVMNGESAKMTVIRKVRVEKNRNN